MGDDPRSAKGLKCYGLLVSIPAASEFEKINRPPSYLEVLRNQDLKKR